MIPIRSEISYNAVENKQNLVRFQVKHNGF